MVEGARPALGLSIGATNLAAVTADHAITRKPVLTLYRQRPPEVGVPSENPRLDEPGLVISDFVDRVGDPIGIVAADGSIHRSEALVADGLRALAYTATGGRALPESVAVTYPAHWRPAAVDSLGSALSRVSEWSNRAPNQSKPLSLIPDAAATLFAARANPGIPARGIVAVCDFGGSGTTITLVDAAGEYQPVGPTVRHHDFSGDLIDQALLTYVMSEMPRTGALDPSGTSSIGSLTRLRAECRNAKEQLSSTTVTTLTDSLPGMRGEIRLTRNELEDTIRDSLDGVVRALEEALGRNGIRTADLVTIVSVGGGANIPAVTTRMSGHFRVPVITTPRPQLTSAIGGALRAARGPGDTSATALTPAAAAAAPKPQLASVGAASMAAAAPLAAVSSVSSVSAVSAAYPNIKPEAPASGLQPALAWSEADDDSRSMPVGSGGDSGSGGSGYTGARPQLAFDRDTRRPAEPERAKIIPWYRLPAVIITGTVVAVLLVGMAVAIGLNSSDKPTAPSPGVSTPPPASAPATQAPESGQSAPAPPQVTDSPQPPPAADAPVPTDPPAPATQAQAPVTQQDAPVPQAPAPPEVPAPPVPAPPQLPVPPNPPAVPAIPQIPVPAIPRIPGISQPIPAPYGPVPGIAVLVPAPASGNGRPAPHGN
jgi:hypothetical protein